MLREKLSSIEKFRTNSITDTNIQTINQLNREVETLKS